jgi:PBP1b-binding outer membrane lipoprotein LpoB
MRKLAFCILAIGLLAFTGCSQEPQPSEELKLCTAKLYKSYDPKNLEQCTQVCLSCQGGTPINCPTSCKLKGAR